VCSPRFETRPREPVRPLARPFASEPARDNEPDKDLDSETCSTRPEAKPREPDRFLVRPLISEPTRDNEPDRDLRHEVCSTRPEAMVKVEVRVAVQERGIELQMSFPESTLATMLPIETPIEAAMVLKIELLSARFEAKPSELLKALAKPFFSEATTDSEPDRCLARPLVSEATRPIVPDRDLKAEDFSTRPETEPSEAVKLKALPFTSEPARDRELLRPLV